jgi:hypothetical protein
LREDQLSGSSFLALSDDALVEILNLVSFRVALTVRASCKYTRAFVPQSFASIDLPGLVPNHVDEFCKLVEVAPCLRSIKLQCTLFVFSASLHRCTADDPVQPRPPLTNDADNDLSLEDMQQICKAVVKQRRRGLLRQLDTVDFRYSSSLLLSARRAAAKKRSAAPPGSAAALALPREERDRLRAIQAVLHALRIKSAFHFAAFLCPGCQAIIAHLNHISHDAGQGGRSSVISQGPGGERRRADDGGDGGHNGSDATTNSVAAAAAAPAAPPSHAPCYAAVGTLLCDMNVDVKGSCTDRVSSSGRVYRFQSSLSCKKCLEEIKGWHCVDVAVGSGGPTAAAQKPNLATSTSSSLEEDGDDEQMPVANSSSSNHNSPRGASLSPRSLKGAAGAKSPRGSSTTVSEVFFCVSADNNVCLDVPPQAEAQHDAFREIAFAFRP